MKRRPTRIGFALSLAAACLAGAVAFADQTPGFAAGGAELYGYLVSLVNGNFDTRDLADSDAGAQFYLRLKGDWSPEEDLAFHLEAAYSANTGNQNPFAALSAYGLWEYPAEVSPVDDFVQSLVIDHAWGSARIGAFDLQAGKIPIGWGTGYVFNPTAKAASLPFLDLVGEETPGTWAVAPSVSLGPHLALCGYLAFQDRSQKTTALAADGGWANLPFGLKVQAVAGAFDLSAGLIKEVFYDGAYHRIYHASADFAGALWDFGVYGEAALRLPEDLSAPFGLGEHLEACAGFDFTFGAIDLLTRLEYYHQGQGAGDEGAYDLSRALSGELTLQAEDYLFLHAERVFWSYVTVSASALLNLNDRSAALIPRLRYQVRGNFEIELGGLLFLGPRGSEFYGRHDVEGEMVDVTQPAVYLRSKLSF